MGRDLGWSFKYSRGDCGGSREDHGHQAPRHPSRHDVGLLRCQGLEKKRVFHGSWVWLSPLQAPDTQTQTHGTPRPTLPSPEPSPSRFTVTDASQTKQVAVLIEKGTGRALLWQDNGIWSALSPAPHIQNNIQKAPESLETCVAPRRRAPTCGAVVFADFATSHTQVGVEVEGATGLPLQILPPPSPGGSR